MKRSVYNAAYGALDYVCYPAGMLLVAPIILHKMGASQYGLWMVATSVVSAGAIIASGFCDAGIQLIAKLRDSADERQIARLIGTLLAITIFIGSLVALALWLGSPLLAPHLARGRALPIPECILALRIAAITALLRAIEAVPTCVQRAYQDYGPPVMINVLVRFMTLGAAALLAVRGAHTAEILLYSLLVMGLSVILQFLCLRRFVSLLAVLPHFHRDELRILSRTGIFVWVQALGGVVFRQFDRILLGVALGAAAVVPYVFSVQLAEPLFGLTASTLSFFFPYLAGRVENLSQHAMRTLLCKAILLNTLIVALGTVLLLIFGRTILVHWAGSRVADGADGIFAFIVLGSALSGLSVVGVYTAQALGLFRITAIISVGSRLALLLLMLLLLHREGARGVAIARLCCGGAALLVYLPIAKRLRLFHKAAAISIHSALAPALQEEGQL